MPADEQFVSATRGSAEFVNWGGRDLRQATREGLLLPPPGLLSLSDLKRANETPPFPEWQQENSYPRSNRSPQQTGWGYPPL